MQMEAVVGGQAVKKQQQDDLGSSKFTDPKQATHGDAGDGPSAMEAGRQVMAMDLSNQKEDPSGLPGKLSKIILCVNSDLGT